jgi:PACS-1 cytosolic sorting protein
LDDWDAQTSFRVSLAGTDAFVSSFVAALLGQLALHPRSEAQAAISCLRFFVLPLGEPSLNTLAREIGARDATYRALFLDAEWLEALDRAVLSKANEKNVVQRILRYTMQAANLLRFPIGQAYITTTALDTEQQHGAASSRSLPSTNIGASARATASSSASSATASTASASVTGASTTSAATSSSGGVRSLPRSSTALSTTGDSTASAGAHQPSSGSTPAQRGGAATASKLSHKKTAGEMVRIRLPFLGSVHVLSLEDDRASSATRLARKEKSHKRTALTPRTWASRPELCMDMQLDYWTPHKREGKDNYQVSLKTTFQEVVVTRLAKLGSEIGIDPGYMPTANTLSTLLCFREKSRRGRCPWCVAAEGVYLGTYSLFSLRVSILLSRGVRRNVCVLLSLLCARQVPRRQESARKVRDHQHSFH